jgi:hypothetical protein
MNNSHLKWRVWKSWVWWTHTWWFQLAHKPLCTRFSQDVLRIGKWRICRSCTMLYSGVAATGIALILGHLSTTALVLLCYGAAVPVIVFSYPPLYSLMGRHTRDVLRFAAGAFVSLLIGLLLHGQFLVTAATSLALLAVYCLYRNKRSMTRSRMCAGCPELGIGGVCTGYARQAESIRAYCRDIEHSLNREDVIPPAVFQLAIEAEDRPERN